MIISAAGTEGGARDFVLAGPRKRHHRIASRAEGAHASSQPGLELGGRAVVGERKACLRRLEPVELRAEHVEAGLDQALGLVEWQLGLVCVAVAMRHDGMALRRELGPEAKVALAPSAVPLFARLAEMARREDVQLGDESKALEDLGRTDRGQLEAVVEAQRDDVHYSVVRGSTETPVSS